MSNLSFSSLFLLEIVLIRHLIPWAGHTHSLAHSSLSLTLPRIVFYRHRLLTLLVRSSYPKSFPNRLVLCPRSPFPGEGEKVLQADAAKNLVESRNEDCDDFFFLVEKAPWD